MQRCKKSLRDVELLSLRTVYATFLAFAVFNTYGAIFGITCLTTNCDAVQCVVKIAFLQRWTFMEEIVALALMQLEHLLFRRTVPCTSCGHEC